MSFELRLMAHNQQWSQEFEQSRSMLLWGSEGWLREVQHIGSTALSDVAAQPTIDMLAGMADMHGLNAAAELIEGLNYARVPSPEWCAEEFTAFLQKPRLGEVTHTALVVRLGGPAWQRALAIRDHLRQSPQDRQRLDRLKREHFNDACDAMERYTLAKNDFFSTLDCPSK